MTVRAPFPWFGGKSRVAHLVWERFGDVPNYVEPFAGSLAVTLGRPTEPRVETVNDSDCYLSNFWRAVQRDPKAVARWADWPINEADLHARHRWLVARVAFRERMKTEPGYFDAKVAGWWVWGISQWIGSGWCSQPSWTGRFAAGSPRGIAGNPSRGVRTAEHRPRPNLQTGQGIATANPPRGEDPTKWNGRPCLSGSQGVHRKRPQLGGHNNKGVHRVSLQIPNLSGDSGAVGRGIHKSTQQKLPKMDRGVASRLRIRTESLIAWFEILQDRLRNVRVCCGDWTRILGPSPTFLIGTTGVFLDPPYEPAEIARGSQGDGFSRSDRLYAEHTSGLSGDVRTWALEHGDNPKLRIALCGYEGEHDMPATWTVLAWKAAGGYSNRGAAPRRNAGRERIWFSPHCLPGALEAGPLFAQEAGA